MRKINGHYFLSFSVCWIMSALGIVYPRMLFHHSTEWLIVRLIAWYLFFYFGQFKRNCVFCFSNLEWLSIYQMLSGFLFYLDFFPFLPHWERTCRIDGFSGHASSLRIMACQSPSSIWSSSVTYWHPKHILDAYPPQYQNILPFWLPPNFRVTGNQLERKHHHIHQRYILII